LALLFCSPREATYTRILKLEPSLPAHLSDQAKTFIRAALKKDPAQRPTVHQMLRHPWLRTYQVRAQPLELKQASE
jgi:aurora kinase